MPTEQAVSSSQLQTSSGSSFTVHLKLARFVFEGQATGKQPAAGSSSGRLFSLHWSRTNRTTPIGKSRFVKASEQHSGMGAVIDFVSQTATFIVEASAMNRQQDRVIVFTLVSRDGSPLGSGPASAEDTTVCSGTIDLSMFTNDSAPKTYALVMESNFYVVGKLHFGLFVTNTPKSVSKVFQERAVVLHVDQVVDDVMETRLHATQNSAAALKISAPHLEDTITLFDDRYYFIKVDMDGTEPIRLPVTKAAAGRATFKTSVPLRPVSKVKFVLCDEKQPLAHGSVKLDKLTASGLPKDFALPLKGEKGSSLRVLFTVKEEMVTREVKTPPLTERQTPTPVTEKAPTPVSPSGPNARISPPVPGQPSSSGGTNKTATNGSRPATSFESANTPLLPKTPMFRTDGSVVSNGAKRSTRDDMLASTTNRSALMRDKTPVAPLQDQQDSESAGSSVGASPAIAPLDPPKRHTDALQSKLLAALPVAATSPPAPLLVPPIDVNAARSSDPFLFSTSQTKLIPQHPPHAILPPSPSQPPVAVASASTSGHTEDVVTKLVARVHLLEQMLLEAHDAIYLRDAQIRTLKEQLLASQHSGASQSYLHQASGYPPNHSRLAELPSPSYYYAAPPGNSVGP